MTSSRPSLINALIDWITDNDCTPFVIVATDVDGVEVPADYVEANRIVLNISPRAVRNFGIADGAMAFDSRFGGRPFRVVAPLTAVVAVYAKETGQGMAFEVGATSLRPTEGDAPRRSDQARPTLTVVR